MIISVEVAGIAYVATDTRHIRTLPDGTESHSDDGGKLRPVSEGWVAVCGVTAVALQALQLIEQTGIHDTQALRILLGSQYRKYQRALQQDLTRELGAAIGIARLVGGKASAEFLQLRTAGAVAELASWDRPMMIFTKGTRDEEREPLYQTLSALLRPEQTVPGVVRSLATIFAVVAARHKTISGDLEIGMMVSGSANHHLVRGGSADLARASNADLMNRIEVVSALPPRSGVGWALAEERLANVLREVAR